MDRFARRVERLKEKIREKDVDGLLVTKPANVSYLIGRDGRDCTLWITEEKNYIITDFRYEEMAMGLSELFEYKRAEADRTPCDIVFSMGAGKLGVEDADISMNAYLNMVEKFGESNIIPSSGLIEDMRMVKDEAEIESTKKACDIACETFDYMCGYLRAGLTEKEVAAELEYRLKKGGAEDISFSTILVSGPNTSLPHGVPTDRKIEKGDFVTLDFGCKVDGYCSDMTRTVAVGEPSAKMREVYDIVLRAQLTACEGVRAGIKGSEADRLARDVIEDAGYGKFFGHGLGHGTGLQIHEAPRLSSKYDLPLKEGNIVSIEPGIYLPGEFGVRIEDLVVVTEFGIINLVTSPKELLVL